MPIDRNDGRSFRAMAARVVIACGLLLACDFGCESVDSTNRQTAVGSSGSGFGREEDSDPVARPWPYWPTRMRVHPLTRMATDLDSNETILEARIEFRDADNVPSRCFGVLRLALHRRGELPRSHPAVQTWELDLRDGALNSRQFDVVTQTYLFKLLVDPADLREGETLWVLYLGGDDTQLEASRAGFTAPR